MKLLCFILQIQRRQQQQQRVQQRNHQQHVSKNFILVNHRNHALQTTCQETIMRETN